MLQNLRSINTLKIPQNHSKYLNKTFFFNTVELTFICPWLYSSSKLGRCFIDLLHIKYNINRIVKSQIKDSFLWEILKSTITTL